MKKQVLHARRIVFVCEQDGDVEKTLKARLTERFRSSTLLTEAYLLRVRYHNSADLDVALCLRTDKGLPDFDAVKAAHSEFADLFARAEHLDVMFLTPVQVEQISLVARPFYRRVSASA